MAAAGTPGAPPTSPSTPPRCSRKVSHQVLALCVTCFREVSNVCPMLHVTLLIFYVCMLYIALHFVLLCNVHVYGFPASPRTFEFFPGHS